MCGRVCAYVHWSVLPLSWFVMEHLFGRVQSYRSLSEYITVSVGQLEDYQTILACDWLRSQLLWAQWPMAWGCPSLPYSDQLCLLDVLIGGGAQSQLWTVCFAGWNCKWAVCPSLKTPLTRWRTCLLHIFIRFISRQNEEIRYLVWNKACFYVWGNRKRT